MLTIIEDVMIVVGHDADVVSFFGDMMCKCKQLYCSRSPLYGQ